MVGTIPGTLPQPVGPGHTKHPKQGLRPPAGGQVVPPRILRDARQSIKLTFPPAHRRHRVTGIFSTIPGPREGTEELGAFQPSDPDEIPRARRSHPRTRKLRGGEGRMFPRQSSTCRAGREIGKAAGAAHARRGALPAGARGWRRGQSAPTRPGRRPPPSPRSGGEIAVGQAGVRRGTGMGQPCTPSCAAKALCRGSSRCHPRGGPGGARGGDARAGTGGGDLRRLRRTALGDLSGAQGTGASGSPTTEAGVGERKEHEAQRGLSSCRLMKEGRTRGGTAAQSGVP